MRKGSGVGEIAPRNCYWQAGVTPGNFFRKIFRVAAIVLCEHARQQRKFIARAAPRR